MNKRSFRNLARRFGRVARTFNRAAIWVVLFAFAVGVFSEPLSGADKIPRGALEFSSAHPNENPTFWLVDEDGSWRAPLPNWTLDEVMRVVDSRYDRQSLTPYSIQRVEVEGAVDESLIARLNITIEVAVADGVVRAPLGLGEGVYIPAKDKDLPLFSYEGPGLCALDVDPKTGDYAAVFQTTPQSEDAPNLAPTSPTESQSGAESQENVVKGDESVEEETPSEEIPSTENEGEHVATNVATETENAPPEAKDPASETQDAPAEEGPADVEEAPNAPVESVVSPEVSENVDDQQTERSTRDAQNLRRNQYRLVLNLCFTVERTESTDQTRGSTDDLGEYRLKASFPPSLHSTMTLRAPISDVKFSTVRGAVADEPTTMSESESELNLRGLGRGGEKMELSWHKDLSGREKNAPETAMTMQVESAAISVELNARDVAYEAVLPIKVFGGETDFFAIQLPEEADVAAEGVSATNVNGAAIEIASAKVEKNETSNEKTLEVQLVQKVAAVELKISAHAVDAREQNASAEELRTSRTISGFAVRDARKQFGTVKVVDAQDARFNVVPVFGAASANDVALEESEDVFNFFSQPFLLKAESYERETIVNVKPEYLAVVGADTITIRARFQYSVYGAKLKELKIKLNGWNLSDVVDPTNMINKSGLRPDGDATIFPLNIPIEGEEVFEFVLTRDNPPEVGANYDRARISIPTPEAEATRAEPGALVVVPENAVQLTPIPEETYGLVEKTARAFSLNLELPKDARQTPLYYQTRSNVEGTDSTAALVADIELMEQEISVDVKTEASISEKGVFRVNQTFEYKIERKPMEQFGFETLARILDTSHDPGVKCFIDAKPTPFAIDQDENYEDTIDRDEFKTAKMRKVSYRVVPDQPKIGVCVVALQYELRPVDFLSEATNYVEVLLFQPKGRLGRSVVKSNVLTLSAPFGVSLAYAKSSASVNAPSTNEDEPREDEAFWHDVQTKISDDGKTESILCRSLVSEFYAKFTAIDNIASSVAVVDRAWIQSWYAESLRVDRATYRVSCKRDLLEAELPEKTALDRVGVSINGKALALSGDLKRGFALEGRLLRIPVADEFRSAPFVLEIDYVTPTPSGAKGRCEAQFPVFVENSAWIRRLYWQPILGYNRHIVVDPKNWIAEFFVKRKSWIGVYGRYPTTSQDELCEWIGIEKREPLPEEANVYLYSAFDPSYPFETPQNYASSGVSSAVIYVADRATIILICAGVILALGLSLLHFPVLRASYSLFIIAVVALAVAAYRPLLSLLVLQTAALGVALTFASYALSKLIRRSDDARATNADARKKATTNGGATE